jgi:hypothetical protein
MEALCDASLVSVAKFEAETDVLVVPETLSLPLGRGLFDVDGEEDNENVNDDVEHDEIEDDKVKEVVCDTLTVAEVLAHTDNREDTEADRDNRALPVEDEDCRGVKDGDIELLDDDEKLLDIEFTID